MEATKPDQPKLAATPPEKPPQPMTAAEFFDKELSSPKFSIGQRCFKGLNAVIVAGIMCLPALDHKGADYRYLAVPADGPFGVPLTRGQYVKADHLSETLKPQEAKPSPRRSTSSPT